MRLYVIIFLLFFVAINSYGQIISFPSAKQNGFHVADFVPAGWQLFDSATGDLNKDGTIDEAIILQHTDSVRMVNNDDDSVLTQPRMLLILFQNPLDRSFHLAEQSSSFILCHDNPFMDDPYVEMTIKKGILQIKFQLFYTSGNWYLTNTSYKFRYQSGQFLLTGANYFSIHRATLDYQEYSYNFLTGKRSYTNGNDKKGTKRTVWKPFAITEQKTLRTFKQPFTWQIEENVYL